RTDSGNLDGTAYSASAICTSAAARSSSSSATSRSTARPSASTARCRTWTPADAIRLRSGSPRTRSSWAPRCRARSWRSCTDAPLSSRPPPERWGGPRTAGPARCSSSRCDSPWSRSPRAPRASSSTTRTPRTSSASRRSPRSSRDSACGRSQLGCGRTPTGSTVAPRERATRASATSTSRCRTSPGTARTSRSLRRSSGTGAERTGKPPGHPLTGCARRRRAHDGKVPAMLDTGPSIEARPANWDGYSLRNYTPVPEMSEETTAYTADLLHEGALVGTISNRGRGGASLVRGQGARLHQERVVDAPSGARYPGTDLIASTDSVLEAIAQTGKALAISRLRAHLVVLADGQEYLTLPEVVFADTLDVH